MTNSLYLLLSFSINLTAPKIKSINFKKGLMPRTHPTLILCLVVGLGLQYFFLSFDGG